MLIHFLPVDLFYSIPFQSKSIRAWPQCDFPSALDIFTVSPEDDKRTYKVIGRETKREQRRTLPGSIPDHVTLTSLIVLSVKWPRTFETMSKCRSTILARH